MSEAHLDDWTYGPCDCCSNGGQECAKMCFCMLCVYVRALEIVGIITRKRCCLCIWFFSCCCCCNRGRVRRRYLIRGKPGLDFACAYCCCPCDCCRVMLEVQHREDRYITACYGVREGYQENLLAEAAGFKKKSKKTTKKGSIAPSPSATSTTANGQADLESAVPQVDDSHSNADKTAPAQSNSWTSPQAAAAEMER
eukprot:INCI18388.2.p1 GENE.INCI18388.2~~INCI18388.2.p1  ORF type:complete len:197 (-),score=18.76 INCI18388.2:430-1020(-)